MIARALFLGITLFSLTPAMAMMPLVRAQANQVTPYAKQVRLFSTRNGANNPNENTQLLVQAGATLIGGLAGFSGGIMLLSIAARLCGDERRQTQEVYATRKACMIATFGGLTGLGAHTATRPEMLGFTASRSGRMVGTVVMATSAMRWVYDLGQPQRK